MKSLRWIGLLLVFVVGCIYAGGNVVIRDIRTRTDLGGTTYGVRADTRADEAAAFGTWHNEASAEVSTTGVSEDVGRNGGES